MGRNLGDKDLRVDWQLAGGTTNQWVQGRHTGQPLMMMGWRGANPCQTTTDGCQCRRWPILSPAWCLVREHPPSVFLLRHVICSRVCCTPNCGGSAAQLAADPRLPPAPENPFDDAFSSSNSSLQGVPTLGSAPPGRPPPPTGPSPLEGPPGPSSSVDLSPRDPVTPPIAHDFFCNCSFLVLCRHPSYQDFWWVFCQFWLDFMHGVS